MQTIDLIDGTARLREFVAAFREKGLISMVWPEREAGTR
jgi:hypothetical protein